MKRLVLATLVVIGVIAITAVTVGPLSTPPYDEGAASRRGAIPKDDPGYIEQRSRLSDEARGANDKPCANDDVTECEPTYLDTVPLPYQALPDASANALPSP